MQSSDIDTRKVKIHALITEVPVDPSLHIILNLIVVKQTRLFCSREVFLDRGADAG